MTGTSDNLEAVSEAASTHSVSSSIELEDQNDNFSDMLSANVSSRGTPNVSGRNTPLSQAEQDENNEVLEEDVIMNEEPNEPVPNQNNLNPPNLNNLNINTPNPSKQARSEIEDKFCKFEIKQQLGGDETVSLVSDTWSTDVLASDSEVGSDAHHHLLPIINQPSASNSNNSGINNGPSASGAASGSNASGNVSNPTGGPANSFATSDLAPATNPDNSTNDTMSEAWSTDVAASDIERMHDFDTDDTSSVTRSDYTGRSEFEGAAYDTPRSSGSFLHFCSGQYVG